jgi:hypothetical protein
MGGGMNTSGTGRQTPLFATAGIIY